MQLMRAEQRCCKGTQRVSAGRSMSCELCVIYVVRKCVCVSIFVVISGFFSCVRDACL
jgi:hypothetical protein